MVNASQSLGFTHNFPAFPGDANDSFASFGETWHDTGRGDAVPALREILQNIYQLLQFFS